MPSSHGSQRVSRARHGDDDKAVRDRQAGSQDLGNDRNGCRVSGDGFGLSELELDALTEVVNIGVSRAATSLRDMVGEQVFLSVPRSPSPRRRERPNC